MISGKIWHSPRNAYGHVLKAAERVGWQEIERSNAYQRVRETKIAAITALMISDRTGKPTFLQLVKDDPPDARLMQRSTETAGQMDLTDLEITTFNGKGNLLEQLQSTKVPKAYHILDEHYILVIDVNPGVAVDYKQISEYLESVNAKYPVWAIQEVSNDPDTIARLTIINPLDGKGPSVMDINVGKAMHDSPVEPAVLFAKRTGSAQNTRIERSEPYEKPPWESFDER